MEQQNLHSEQAELKETLKVRHDKLRELQQQGQDPFDITKYDTDTHAAQITENFEQYEGATVSLAGRIMSKRGMGKASFCDIQDSSGRIQLYCRKDGVGEAAYENIKKLDIGDIAGVKGEVFRTHKGEISVKVSEFTLLAKSLQPLPEKYHGLKDTDLRYRKRYVDLIVNPEVMRVFVARSKIITEIRRILDEKNYIEVESPVLNNISGGATARPFVTHHNTLDIDMYLRIALELHHKRLIVGGLERVYEIGRVFRNEGMSHKHSPEYTMLELYQAYTDYQGMMELTEQMVCSIAQKLHGTLQIPFKGRTLNFTAPWKRISMADAVQHHTGINFTEMTTDEQARAAAKQCGIAVTEKNTWGECLEKVFDEKVEPYIYDPTFITNHPVDISPLAKRCKHDPRVTERFEIFVSNMELGNAFSELNDPIDQRERFVRQEQQRIAGNDEAGMMDEDFLTAIEHGMPPTGGLGIGIDRLVMLMTDCPSIRDVILFPTMKPLN